MKTYMANPDKLTLKALHLDVLHLRSQRYSEERTNRNILRTSIQEIM